MGEVDTPTESSSEASSLRKLFKAQESLRTLKYPYLYISKSLEGSSGALSHNPNTLYILESKQLPRERHEYITIKNTHHFQNGEYFT